MPLAYTLKMSYKTGHAIDGFFEYVVPPLEGFWWSESGAVDFRDKSAFQWVSAIRLPDNRYTYSVEEASRKKKLDCSGAFFYHLEEGLCVQMMHLGPYDSEPASLEAMDAFARETGTSPIFPKLAAITRFIFPTRESPRQKSGRRSCAIPSAKRKNTLPCLAGGCFVIRLPAIQFRVLQQIPAQPQHQHGDGRVYQ